MDNTNYNQITTWMHAHYGDGADYAVTCDGTKYTGKMYGDSECFDVNEFFQYIVTPDGKLLEAYYKVPKDQDLEEIDYDHPYRVDTVDAEYVIR